MKRFLFICLTRLVFRVQEPTLGTLEVIDDEEESPDKWRGDFHGFNFILETYDVRFMESHQLEERKSI